jgi:hypothetical protein
MSAYTTNRRCPCARCRFRGLMGPAILITLGVLFLLNEMWVIRFDDSWPALLIVIGLFMYLGRSASTEGHIEPYSQSGTAPPNVDNPSGPEVRQ